MRSLYGARDRGSIGANACGHRSRVFEELTGAHHGRAARIGHRWCFGGHTCDWVERLLQRRDGHARRTGGVMHFIE